MNTQKEVIIITGSNGLIGQRVVRHFARQFDVVGFNRTEPPYPLPAAKHIQVDLVAEESIRRGLGEVHERYGGHIASVVHLAAYYEFSGEPNSNYEEVNVRGTERLLRALRGFEVGQFIFASPMLVHAPCVPGQRIGRGLAV